MEYYSQHSEQLSNPSVIDTIDKMKSGGLQSLPWRGYAAVLGGFLLQVGRDSFDLDSVTRFSTIFFGLKYSTWLFAKIFDREVLNSRVRPRNFSLRRSYFYILKLFILGMATHPRTFFAKVFLITVSR